MSRIYYYLCRISLEHYHRVVPSKKKRYRGSIDIFLYKLLVSGLTLILQKTQYLPPEDMSKLQLSLLKKKLGEMNFDHSYWRQKNIPEEFNVTSLKDFETFPFMTKNDLRNIFTDQNEEEDETLQYYTTSGTSGYPLRFSVYQGYYMIYRSSIKIRTLSLQGKIPFLKIIWSNHGIFCLNMRIPYLRIIAEYKKTPPNLSKEDAEEITNRFRKEKFPVLYGFPSSLTNIYTHFPQGSLRDSGLKLIHTGGERLPDNIRKDLERAYAVPILRCYGMSEFGVVGEECQDKRNTYHLHEEFLIVEIIDNNGDPIKDTSWGEIVVTSLLPDSVTPFLRYRTGDAGRLSTEPCSCGVSKPRIELQGRMMTNIKLPSGKNIPSISLYRIMSFKGRLQKLSQFQFIQNNDLSLTILVVEKNNAEFLDVETEDLINDVKSMCIENIKIQLKKVASIPTTDKGKAPMFISKLNPADL